MDAASELELLRAILETQRLVDECEGDIDAVMGVVAECSRALTEADQAVVELVEGRKPIGWAAAGSLPTAVGSRTEVVMRLPVSGEHVGTLAVLASAEGAFDGHDLELLDALGDLVANVVHHARVVAERDERARRDDLTGLANRRHLLDRLAVALARATHNGHAVTVLFLDLDGFKPVNDTLGHRAGDQVLRAVGRAVAATVRPTDTVARLVGDQFVIVCEGMPEAYTANLVERVRRTVATAWPGPLPLTACVGMARSTMADSAEALLARSDDAMFALKQARTL